MNIHLRFADEITTQLPLNALDGNEMKKIASA